MPATLTTRAGAQGSSMSDEGGPIDPGTYSSIVWQWAEDHLAKKGIPAETAAAKMVDAVILRLVKLIGKDNTRAYVQSLLTDEALDTAAKINEAREGAAASAALHTLKGN